MTTASLLKLECAAVIDQAATKTQPRPALVTSQTRAMLAGCRASFRSCTEFSVVGPKVAPTEKPPLASAPPGATGAGRPPRPPGAAAQPLVPWPPTPAIGTRLSSVTLATREEFLEVFDGVDCTHPALVFVSMPLPGAPPREMKFSGLELLLQAVFYDCYMKRLVPSRRRQQADAAVVREA